MHSFRDLPVFTALLATTFVGATTRAVGAQDNPFVPAAEQEALHKLVGLWQGSGKWRLTADAAEEDWTATIAARSILNGQFVQEDHTVNLGPSVPGLLRIRHYYGYDKENKRYMMYTLNNMGEISANEVHLDGNQLLYASSVKRQGVLTTEHWVSTITKDSYRMRGTQIAGTGKPFTHVHGSYERVKIVPAAFKNSAVMSFAPLGKPMKRISKMAGTYRIDGWMIPMVGAEKVPIGAEESMKLIYGGSVLEIEVVGDDSPMGAYHGLGAIAWDDQANCYKQLWVSNMGEGMVEDARFLGKELVSTGNRLQYGLPTVARTIATFHDDGTPATANSHITAGNAAPVHGFSATYKKVGQKNKK